MKGKLEGHRLALFLGLAFGIAWAVAAVVALTGGLAASPQIIPVPGFTLALVLLAVGYMGAPALAHVLTRILTQEGWEDTRLRPKLKKGYPYYLAAWFLPGVITILGAGLFFLLFPAYFDPQLGTLRQMLPASSPLPLNVVVGLQVLQAVLIAPLINSLFTFGEEFGWRAYLLPKLMPLGPRTAVLVSGIIWGVWHAPIIAMGHNYGLDYPFAPWLGMLAMTWFTILVGTFLSWTALRSGSVWPAVIGHAAVNGISGLGVLAVRGQPSTLVGPLPTGVIGGAAWLAAALLILLSARSLAPTAFQIVDPKPEV